MNDYGSDDLLLRTVRHRHHDRGASAGGHCVARRAAVAALATLAMVAVAAPALPAAAVGNAGNGSFGLTPAPASDGRAAPYFTMNVAGGQSVVATAIIANLSRATEKLRISRSTGVTAANGGSAFNRSYQSCRGPGCWVNSLPSTITLPAGVRETLPFTVRVPAGTRRRQYLAGITAELATAPPPVQVGSNGKSRASAIIIQQVTVGVAVTVGSLSRMTDRLVIPDVLGGAIGTLARLNIKLANTGQQFAHGKGQASCTVAGTRHSFAVVASTVLPQDRAVIPVNAQAIPEGSTVPCTVRIRYGNGLIARWAGSVTIPSPPRVRVIHTGPGAYSVVPVGGVPTWAVALLVLGLLILAAAAALLLRRRRNHAY
jgi:LPXTG-motif cell wall-anchored protein